LTKTLAEVRRLALIVEQQEHKIMMQQEQLQRQNVAEKALIERMQSFVPSAWAPPETPRCSPNPAQSQPRSLPGSKANSNRPQPATDGASRAPAPTIRAAVPFSSNESTAPMPIPEQRGAHARPPTNAAGDDVETDMTPPPSHPPPPPLLKRESVDDQAESMMSRTRSRSSVYRQEADRARQLLRSSSEASEQSAVCARLLACQRELALLVARRLGRWILADAIFKQKVRQWMRSFARLDPRTSIAHFFYPGRDAPTGVYVEEAVDRSQRKGGVGGDGDEDEDHDDDHVGAASTAHGKLEHGRSTKLAIESLAVPDSGHYFTVFRPTSKEALRLMMSRRGVGKGMDIKGKSAKTGRVSGFVPFLQVSRDADVERVPMPKGMEHATVRVYFGSEEARDTAYCEALFTLAPPPSARDVIDTSGTPSPLGDDDADLSGVLQKASPRP
jgi:hypothetical protein